MKPLITILLACLLASCADKVPPRAIVVKVETKSTP